MVASSLFFFFLSVFSLGLIHSLRLRRRTCTVGETPPRATTLPTGAREGKKAEGHSAHTLSLRFLGWDPPPWFHMFGSTAASVLCVLRRRA